MTAITYVFSDPIFDSFRFYCAGNNMIVINDLDDSEIDLFKKLCKPTEEEFRRVITQWEKAKVTYKTDCLIRHEMAREPESVYSIEKTCRVQLIQKMEKHFKENSRYISAEQATKLSDEEVKIVEANPNLFFKCTGKRAVLVKWIIIELDCLFLQRQISFLVFEVIYEHLLNYFNVGFERDNLEKILETDNFITHKKFLVIRDKYLKMYDDEMGILSGELTQPDLKECLIEPSSSAEEVPAVDLQPTSQPGSRLTIKEAIIRVLEAELHAMTAEQIYNKIVTDKLYSFGAQNPRNVVRVEIDRACVNSNYTVRTSKNCFRFERNQKGEKVYFLLLSTLTGDTAQASIIVGGESAKPEQANGAVERTQNFKPLVDAAASESSTTPEAVHKFVGLDGRDISIHVETASPIQIIANSELDEIIDLEEGKNGIREILNAHFLTLYGYSNVGILWSAAQNSLSMFLNDNAINSADDFGRFVVRAFKNEFVFSLPHIWQNEPDYPQSSRGLIINLARQHGGVVTREQIDGFFSRIKLTSLYNSFVLDKGQLLFYDNEKFILTETVNPSSERCSLFAKALNTLFSCENTPFVVLRDMSSLWFSRLPELPNGLQWTPLLLQELLRICPEIGCRIISPNLKGQALDTVGAAIVPSKSEIETFADIVHRFSYGKYKLPFKLSAEELRLDLREAGMLDGNELIYNMHKALKDYRFAFSDENRTVMILER